VHLRTSAGGRRVGTLGSERSAQTNTRLVRLDRPRLLAGYEPDEGTGVSAEMVEDHLPFVFGGTRRVADDSRGRVPLDTEGRQVAAVASRVVGGRPAVTEVGRVGRQQHGRLEFSCVHVVVVAAGDARGRACLNPVFATWVEAHPDAAVVLIGLLDDVGEDRVSAVCRLSRAILQS